MAKEQDKKQQDDISTLKTDVAVIKNDMKYVKKAIDGLAFASQSDFDALKKDVEKLKDDLQNYKDKHAVGAAFGDMFSNSAFQYVIGGILALAAVALAKIAGVKIL